MDRRMRRASSALLILLPILIPCLKAFVPDEDGPVTSQEALEGGETTLYCDVTTHVAGDELMLLVWYKAEEPIYSYDARIENEWSSDTFDIDRRLLPNVQKNPTELTITKLTEDDQDLYHCRVDFLLSPTRNVGVNLTVTVLPRAPFIFDELNEKVEKTTGPHQEGDTLVLNCLVVGGRPPPHISWYSGDSLVDESDGDNEVPGVKENQLYLPLAREHAAPLTCRASNTKLVPPISTTLQVELYLPVESVKISWAKGASNGTLRSGRRAVARCVARGSKPIPDVTWWLDHKHLTQHSNQSWDQKTSIAASYLELIPSVSDNGATLSCVATNVAMAPSRGSKADLLVLNVTFSPIVEVVHVDTGNTNEIVELDSLHLECEIKANPPVERITWYFNDNVIVKGDLWGEINDTSSTLFLEEMTRKHAGLYSCAAANPVGETRSHQLSITVFYPPECLQLGITLINETVHCNVQALPSPDTYLWHVKTDTEEQHLTTGSALLPLSQLLGTLGDHLRVVCEAGNGIASQYRPCEKSLSLSHLKPPMPQQCELTYESDTFQIRCVPVENATHYEVSVWRMSALNTSLVLERRARATLGNPGWLVRANLGELKASDETGAASCNRYGCSQPLLLRPTDTLLYKAAPPWWNVFLEKDVSISIGAVVLVAVFVISTILLRRLFRRPKPPQPVIQVLQLDDVAREYLDTLDRKHQHHPTCSSRSASSGYSGGSLDLAPPVERSRKPLYYWEQEPPPDVTLTLHRESAV